MKIANKLTLYFLVVLIIPLSVISFVLLKNSQTNLENQVIKSLEISADEKESFIQAFFQGKIDLTQAIAEGTVLKEQFGQYNDSPSKEKKDALSGLLRDSLFGIADVESLSLINTGGIVIASTNTIKIGTNESKETFITEGINKAGIYFCVPNEKVEISFIAPVVLKNKTIGFIKNTLKTDSLKTASNEVKLGKTGEVILAIMHDGKIVYLFNRLFESQALLQTKNNTDVAFPIKTALSGKNITIPNSLDYRGVKVMAVARYIEGAKIGLVTKIDIDEANAPLKNTQNTTLAVSLFGILLAVFIAYFTAKTITNPILELTNAVSDISKGNLDKQITILDKEKKDEVTLLATAFNKMALDVKKSRADVDQRVSEQTKDIIEKSAEVARTQKATLNILEDIEKEKELSESLAKDLEKFKMAVENASDHIVITDPNGVILYANKAVTRITGFSREEVIGQKVGSKQNWGGIMPAEVYKVLWNTVKIEKKNFTGGLNNHRKNGEKYEVLSSISPILDKRGNVLFFVSIEHDITKEKEIDRAKTEFVSLASLQLRTPLSSISWYLEMLLREEVGAMNEKQKEYLAEAYANSQRMGELVGAFLNVSRIELGTFAIQPTLLDVSVISKELLNELKQDIAKKQIEIKQTYGENSSPFLADQKLLRIIFQNILSNAVKYVNDKGMVELNVQKSPAGTDFGGQKLTEESLTITVSDSGIGIPEAQQTRIFEKLFRADNAASSQTEGNGLGLYLVKSIVEQSGGHIWFVSAENKGATFYIALPATGMKKKEGTKELG